MGGSLRSWPLPQPLSHGEGSCASRRLRLACLVVQDKDGGGFKANRRDSLRSGLRPDRFRCAASVETASRSLAGPGEKGGGSSGVGE